MNSWFRKVTFTLVLALVGCTLFSSGLNLEAQAELLEETDLSYKTIIEVEDWGPAITKLIVDLGTEVPVDSVTVDTFDVHVSLSDNRLGTPVFAQGDRTVTKAYTSDRDGNLVKEGKSRYIILEMEIGPEVTLGNAMNYDFLGTGHNNWINYSYTITQKVDINTGSIIVSGLVIDTFAGETRKLVEQFNEGEATYNDVKLSYADYSPVEDNKKNPLVIWLHGAGEGGTDPTVAIAGNKVVNFISEDIQSYFDNAYILAPQTPTYWMNSINGGYGTDGTSIYQEALMSLIVDYVANNPDIDPSRVYIGGDSNGGYMTMLMLRDYPDYFAAGFPTCEALSDSLISDADIANLAKTPIWFVHAKNDPVVDPNGTVIPTYNRLVEAGADVHLSLYDDVHDQTGLYNDENGNPYQYMGHFSWIYVYNNDPTKVINGEDTTIMEWVANQSNELNSYQTLVEIEDWGPAVTKVIVDLGTEVSKEAINKDTFQVHVSRSDERFPEPFLEGGFRSVTNAYVSDEKGNIVKDGKGSYAVIEMKIGPAITLGSPMNYDFFGTGHNDWIDYVVTVYQVEDIVTDDGTVTGLIMDNFEGEIRELVDLFKTGQTTYGDVTLSYADFTPEKDNNKNPLFIWLHGAGEGGTDATVAISGNKVVNFISDENQSHLDNAYVLAPQTPTFWMDGDKEFGDGTSIYEDALMCLIKQYVADNPDIDPRRIYIGGDSNGGYMTMLMLRDYPDYFAAGLPTAEALQDELISDEDIENLAKTPIWFVHAKNDTIVNPNTTVIPTYNRLVAAGADVHISLYDDVRDQSGLYNDDHGEPYQYMGHWSWIYVYNNDPSKDINGKETTILEWMANQLIASEENEDEPAGDNPGKDDTDGNSTGDIGDNASDDQVTDNEESGNEAPVTGDVLDDEKDSDNLSGEQLPDTATNTFNYFGIGMLLLMSGTVFLFIQNRKNKLSKN